MAIRYYHPQWGAQRPICGILMDMDGLVLDTERLFSRFWQEACAFYGYTMTFQQSLGMRSLNREAGAARLREYLGPEADYPTIRAKRIEMMNAYLRCHGPQPKPGIFSLLDVLDNRGIPAAITSSSPPERIAGYLKALGLYSRFQAICSGHQVPRGKPEPDIYLYGAACLGLDPGNCLALEDSPTGILSAYRAGCLPVLIPDLDDPWEEVEACLYAKAGSLSDIISLL